jgi:hypothetical protein
MLPGIAGGMFNHRKECLVYVDVTACVRSGFLDLSAVVDLCPRVSPLSS